MKFSLEELLRLYEPPFKVIRTGWQPNDWFEIIARPRANNLPGFYSNGDADAWAVFKNDKEWTRVYDDTKQ